MAQEGTDLIPAPSSGDHVRGSLDAPVVISEFGDFECPYCGEAFGVLEAIREQYGQRVALVFRHYPLPMHPHAIDAAEAAEAAASVGKFWEMHDELFRHQAALRISDLRAYAAAIGVDGDGLVAAINDETYAERIVRDQGSGDQSGIEATPALFINGFAYEDEVSVAALAEVIDRALATVRTG
ncbi:MAG TPA: thioredoxin domain-containing protein [Candidatus Baltobacteraceae bacterium]|nr:thioredoxin domain-containing protein [Candidatus Baltobacteraceae bacterium]